MTLLYVAVLVVACYALLVTEFFVPSGGVIGFAAAVAAVTALFIAFTHSLNAGLGTLLLFLASTPAVMVTLVRLWPRTAMGRRMLNRDPDRPDEAAVPTTPQGTPLAELVGRLGVARTDLLPSGQVVIDGEKLDAISDVAIDRGTPIVVNRLMGFRIRVRPATEEELRRQDGSQPSGRTAEALESLDLEGLE